MINITLPDGTIKQYPKGTTSMQIAESISMGLAQNVLSAKVDGEVWDASRPINADASLQLLTWNDKDGRATFWHSSAHLMAEALESLYPGVKFGIGPAIETGFYYDIDTGDKTIGLADLEAIEKKMAELAGHKNHYIRKEVSKADAIQYFTEKGDQYKLELIDGLEDGQITFYTQGGFTDLCKGPHIPDTGKIKAIKLTNVAGAYWRGDEKRPMMTRIYGVTFPKQKELQEYLTMIEEAKKRDHRKLGAELELFMFSDLVGAGLPIWLPKGAALRGRLEEFLKSEQIKRGYQQVITPHIGKKELYETSGHWAKYGADSFQPIHTPKEDEIFLLKPMNCPHHCEIFGHKPRSYKELPLRIAEFGTVYRYEQSGELHGLTRVRGFTQDDAHIFCTPDQLKDEFLNVLDLTMYVIRKLGFDSFTAQISLRDPENKEKYIGSDEVWEKAESAIIDATREAGLETVTELGEAAFYGPKLDFMIKDALGRRWQLGTIQVDYNLPERFNLEYIGADNTTHRPVMIHRAPFGSMERFIGVLTEHTAGKFPLWLAPEQYAILPISERFVDYCKEIQARLSAVDIRGILDERNETIGRKIRDTELKRIPYMLIVGEKEVEENKVAVRKQGAGDQGAMNVEDFITYFKKELEGNH
ncbi:MAG TPA: threonine--tRNA ligase [Saprospiraceae bacterium]|jgi:threonyl-tRNA synthetase|nr:threonine--tRNA ligase [Candidatus Parvibacillus calidus]MBX2935629.1 threonine--tRNA ligase [Saprospiraceae bacterium]MBX7178662.1 threonine--tRNA ligase [Saprospiraceae bacterium]MCB0590745.1 threonine--tRNA ligase [Saprospiraceae bacterium]MCO5284662.1 threonine--tRNA ligase [Saprospiraceae bacterium]